MYYVIVVLLLFVCPFSSVIVEALRQHVSPWNVELAGRWWTFWAVGVRLFLAGIRQVIQPGFTAQEIFGVHDLGVLPIVREIGFGNLSIGVLGILSVFHSQWQIPAAIVGGLYYLLAGVGHLGKKDSNGKEQMALLSDFFAAGMIGWFVFRSLS